MQQIFLSQEPVDGQFLVEGSQAHHLVKVVRIRPGEKLRVSIDSGHNYICQALEVNDGKLTVEILKEVPSTELPNKIYLFQAIPKGDRMETIIEKCVELGVYEIIPVAMKNCIVKLDEKKKKTRVERYRAIATSAAEQSKRSIVPGISQVMTFKEALDYADQLDVRLLPYECKNGMFDTYSALANINRGDSIGVFIGPEGGFDASEIEASKDRVTQISLGSRILRTDTAAICTLSMLMLKCEEL